MRVGRDAVTLDAEPERLVQIWETYQPNGTERGGVAPNNFLDWGKQAQSFEGFSASWNWGYSLTGTNEPTEIFGMKFSPNYFSLLGVKPQLGRLFLPEEDQLGKSKVVVISHSLWQQRFGGDAATVGKTIKLDDEVYTIIGVLRPDFRQFEMTADYSSGLWTPLVLDPAANAAGGPRISAPGSRVSAWVIPTDEELMIARHTRHLLRSVR